MHLARVASCSAPPPSRVPSQRLASITAAITAPAGAAHSRAAALSSPAAASQAAGTNGSSGTPTDSTGLLQQQQAGVNGRSSPVPIPGRGANGGSAGGGSGGGSGSNEGLAALSNLGNVMSSWGRNLLGAGVVDSLANNEGLKAFVAGKSGGLGGALALGARRLSRSHPGAAMDAHLGALPTCPRTGSWNKGPAEGIRAASAASSRSNDAGQGPGTAPAAPAASATAAAAASSSSTRASAMSHRHTNSFTAVMDPLGLNIIEDYAAQSEQEGGGGEGAPRDAAAAAAKQLPQVVEETASATGSPAAAEAGPLSAAANASSSRTAKHTPSRSPSPSKGGGGDGSSSTSARRVCKGSKKQTTAAGGVDGGADASLREPLLAAAGSSASSPSSSGGDGSAGEGQGPGQGAASGGGSSSSSRSATPVQAGAKQQTPPSGQSKRPGSRAVSAFVGAGSSPLGPGALGSHSASPLVGDRPASGRSSAPSPLMRRSASPMLVYGGDQLAGGSSSSLGGGSPGAVMRLGLAGSSPQSPGYEALGGWLPAVEPGQEEEDEVQVEVFEHERAQPFRGWGHTWPGHFLPSDKVCVFGGGVPWCLQPTRLHHMHTQPRTVVSHPSTLPACRRWGTGVTAAARPAALSACCLTAWRKSCRAAGRGAMSGRWT
jgi:hypothetical protein